MFRRILAHAILCAGMVFGAGTSAAAETLAEAAARFGALPTVRDISISPDGTKLLYIEPGKQAEESLLLVNLESDAPPQMIATFNEANARMTSCSWANDVYVVCRLYGYNKAGDIIFTFTRPFSINVVTGDIKSLTPDSNMGRRRVAQSGGKILALDVPGKDNMILMTRRYFKEAANSTLIYNDKEGLGVDLINLKTGRGRTVERPNEMAVDYIADENGEVRIMGVSDSAASGYDGSDLRYLYRAKGSDKWQPLSSVDAGEDLLAGFIPVAIDSASDVVYGFERDGGYLALFSLSLDGAATKQLLLKKQGLDVDGLERIGRKDRVVGASFAAEARIVEYFDAELAKIARGLTRALPGQPLIGIRDASEDESRIILTASNDTDPGMIYLFDKSTNQLGELLPVREPLLGRELAEMKPIIYPAADGTQIPGFLTLPPGSDGKNLPAIVLPHGGPGSRDVLGFDWLPQFFAARGFAVLQPNFRGSAGYGEQWFGRNGFKAWDVAIGDVNDAGRWLISQGIADAERLGILGWSYGGYAALQSQVVDPDLFKAVGAIAPVTDLDLLIEENRPYTSFVATRRMIGTGDHVAAGSPAKHADRFAAPVLLVHGTMDLNTRVGQSRLMKSRLEDAGKQVDYLEFDGLDHYIVHAQARAIMLRRLGGFFETNLSQ